MDPNSQTSAADKLRYLETGELPDRPLRIRLERLASKKLWSAGEIQELAAVALELEQQMAAMLEGLAALAGYIDAGERRQRPEVYNGAPNAAAASRTRGEPRTVLEVPCPACGAPAGSKCVSEQPWDDENWAVELSEPHTARLEEAARS